MDMIVMLSKSADIKLVCYKPGELLESRILVMLTKLDKDYIPPISSQTPLVPYAQKLAQNADIILVENNCENVGLCAIYTNIPPLAFITSIGLLQSVQGQGLGADLIHLACNISSEKGCTRIGLEVHQHNKKAQEFYIRKGFSVCDKVLTIAERRELFLYMEREI